jgi:hypothetical protein
LADLAAIKDFVTANNGTLAASAFLEEEGYIAEELESVTNTANLEEVATYPVEQQTESEFCFFEDGIQRTLYIGQLLANGAHIPVHYCTVAATILERSERCFHPVDGLLLKKDLILVSKSHIPKPGTLDRLEAEGVTIVDTGVTSTNFNELCRKAQYWSKAKRLELEAELIELWDKTYSGPSFLVVDGTIMNLRSEDAVARCLGISKQIQERHHELADHKKILGLKNGERSWTFSFKGVDEDSRMGARDRISWYLRIRDTKGRHPEFGLLRCEISKRHKDAAPELADRLSRSLCAERFPIAYPDSRWDRLLYPIRQCEQYLRSKCKPVRSIQAAFGRTQRI